MKKSLNLFLLTVSLTGSCFNALSQLSFSVDTASVTCTGSIGSFKSGNVDASGVLTDNIIMINGSNATPASVRGWMVFDLSTLSIPAGSVIYDASLVFDMPNAPSGGGQYGGVPNPDIYGNPGDLSTLALNNQGNALYNSLASGTFFSTSSWAASSGMQDVGLDTAGVNFIINNINGAVTFGFTAFSTVAYTLNGYNGAPGSQPRLIINYAPPCLSPVNPGAYGCGNACRIDSLVLVGENSTAFYDYATGCAGTSAYDVLDDRTAQPAVDLKQGSNYNIMVSTSTNYENYAAVWIDLNNDSLFDGNERVTAMKTTLRKYMTPVPVNIPGNATPGLRRMRVMVGKISMWAGRNATSFLPCNNNAGWDRGEVHDYMINVTANPLAINLENLSVKNEGPVNVLRWNTLAEGKTDVFEIERSGDGRNFWLIGRLEAKGSASTYTFHDAHALEGMNYYRLKMKGADAGKMYSRVVSTVTTNKGSEMTAHPNPVNDLLNIDLNIVPAQNARIMLFDIAGKLILQEPVVAANIQINVKNLHSGIYFVRYIDSGYTSTVKISKN